MTVRVLLVVAVVMALYGCGQSSSAPEQGDQGGSQKEPAEKEISVPANVPNYDVTKDEKVKLKGIETRDVAASTDAKSGQDFEAITRKMWADTENARALWITFFPNKPMAAESGWGMAVADESAARALISSMYSDPSEADVEGQVDEVMENDGIYIISMKDTLQSFSASASASSSP